MKPSEGAALLKTFREKLAEQHKLREGRPFEVWHSEEIRLMWTLVNAERLLRDRSFISRDEIKRAESFAAGHVDYALKFALYCRDLVFEEG